MLFTKMLEKLNYCSWGDPARLPGKCELFDALPKTLKKLNYYTSREEGGET